MAQEKIKYSYHIKDTAGKYREGVITASSVAALTADFDRRGFTLLEEPKAISTTGLKMEITLKKKRVKPREIALFARKFSSMQDAGIPIKKILSVLAASKGQNPLLRETLIDIQERINAGLTLSQAMGAHPTIFSDLMISMTKAGEEGGFLDKSMRQIAENLEADVKLRSKIKSAMTYPVVVLALAGVMCLAMLIFIVPVFQEMFDSLGGELPLPTQILVVLSGFLKKGIIPIAIVVFAAVTWWRKNKMKMYVRNIKDPLMLKLPVIGLLTNKIVMSRFSRNLGTLLENGVPILRAMDIVAATTGSVVVERALADMALSLQRGGSIGGSMEEHTIFPQEDVEMIKVGEEAGDIVPMLLKISDIYDQDVEATTEALTSLIEPLMIAFLGVVVGGMIVALYMPMFSIYDQIK
ncbi:MAG: type II secretion system F family protein [Enterococcus sp.]|nr:type II secretion system F family protein [Enterococcus sp.]